MPKNGEKGSKNIPWKGAKPPEEVKRLNQEASASPEAGNVVTTLRERLLLWRQNLERQARVASEKTSYEPTLEDIQKFALELEKDTRSCDQAASMAMQSRIMVTDSVDGGPKKVEDFRKALVNLSELDSDIYCRAVALAFLQMKAAADRKGSTEQE